ncbi:MAG TPA: hypothetical protein VGK47_09285 [Nitrososphaeraceae archaeon]
MKRKSNSNDKQFKKLEEGALYEDNTSPTGYSICSNGKLMHMVVAADIDQDDEVEEPEEDAAERNNRLRREHNELMYETIVKSKKAIILAHGFGYALVVVKRILTIQKNNDNNAFQPFERAEERTIHEVVILSWDSPPRFDEATLYLLKSGCAQHFIAKPSDVMEFLNRERE